MNPKIQKCLWKALSGIDNFLVKWEPNPLLRGKSIPRWILSPLVSSRDLIEFLHDRSILADCHKNKSRGESLRPLVRLLNRKSRRQRRRFYLSRSSSYVVVPVDIRGSVMDSVLRNLSEGRDPREPIKKLISGLLAPLQTLNPNQLEPQLVEFEFDVFCQKLMVYVHDPNFYFGEWQGRYIDLNGSTKQ